VGQIRDAPRRHRDVFVRDRSSATTNNGTVAMTRRDFLLSTAAAVALHARDAAAVPGPASAPSIPAIDTHIHLYDPARPQGIPWPPKTDAMLYQPHLPENFRTTVAPCHVVGTVVVEASDWVEDNQWILDLAKTNTEIVGFVGNLRAGQPEFAGNLRRFAAEPLFRGLRLKSSDLKNLGQAAFDADLRRVADAGLAVDVLGGPAMLAPTVQLAQRLPTLRLVVDHLPFKEWDGDIPALRTALAAVAARQNIFVKLSDVVRRVNGRVVTDAAFYRPALDALLELFGPERVLYGSNWPVSNRIAPYAVVRRVVTDYFASQDRVTAEGYFWRNSHQAYRWLRRGAAATLKP
jgi:L-fuconolactonase